MIVHVVEVGGGEEEDPYNEKGTRRNLITESLPGTRLSEIAGGCDFEGKQSLKSCYNVYNATIRCGGEHTDRRAGGQRQIQMSAQREA